jgi:hypothetical protein
MHFRPADGEAIEFPTSRAPGPVFSPESETPKEGPDSPFSSLHFFLDKPND